MEVPDEYMQQTAVVPRPTTHDTDKKVTRTVGILHNKNLCPH